MNACCVSMSNITHLNTCLFLSLSCPTHHLRTGRVRERTKPGEGLFKKAQWNRRNPPVHSQPKRISVDYNSLFICWNGGFIKEALSVCGLQIAEYTSIMICEYRNNLLTGSCDSAHSLECVGPCSVLLPGHRGLAVTLCVADRGWPLVSESCVTSLLHPPLPSPSASLPTALWDKVGVTGISWRN